MMRRKERRPHCRLDRDRLGGEAEGQSGESLHPGFKRFQILQKNIQILQKKYSDFAKKYSDFAKNIHILQKNIHILPGEPSVEGCNLPLERSTRIHCCDKSN